MNLSHFEAVAGTREEYLRCLRELVRTRTYLAGRGNDGPVVVEIESTRVGWTCDREPVTLEAWAEAERKLLVVMEDSFVAACAKLNLELRAHGVSVVE